MAHFAAGHYFVAHAASHLLNAAANHHHIGHALGHLGIHAHARPPVSTIPSVGAHSRAIHGLGLLGNYRGHLHGGALGAGYSALPPYPPPPTGPYKTLRVSTHGKLIGKPSPATAAVVGPHHRHCALNIHHGMMNHGAHPHHHHCTCAAGQRQGSTAGTGSGAHGHTHHHDMGHRDHQNQYSSYGIYSSLFKNEHKELFYEPLQRCFHVLKSLENKAVMYGGYFDEKVPDTKLGLEILSTMVYIYDPYAEMWTPNRVSGEALPVGCGDAASAFLGNDLYIYAATDQQGNTTNMLHRLDTKSMVWETVSQRNPQDGPNNLSGCAMITFDKHLGVFGGVCLLQNGKSPLSMQPNIDIPGCSNEYYIFDTLTNQWELVATIGDKPQPRYHFTFTQVEPSKAVLFGGYIPGYGLTNSVFIFDIPAKRWKYIQGLKKNDCPVPRNKHAACCLNYGAKYPQLFMTGGVSKVGVLDDSWMLNVTQKTWEQIPNFLTPRNGHSLAAITLCPGVVEVLAFGGCSQVWMGIEDKQPKMAWTATYVFENYRNDWNLRSQANFSQLGTWERQAEKETLYRIKQGIQQQTRRENLQRQQPQQQNTSKDNRDLHEFKQRLACLKAQECIENISACRAEETLLEQKGLLQEKRRKMMEETRNKTEYLSRTEQRVTEKEQELQEEWDKLIESELRLEGEKLRTFRARRREEQLENESENISIQLRNMEESAKELNIRINDLVKVTEAQPKTLQEKDLIRVIMCANNEQLKRSTKTADDAEKTKRDAEERVESATNKAKTAEEKLRFAENLSLFMLKQSDRRVALAEEEKQVLVRQEAEVKIRLKIVTQDVEEVEEQLQGMDQALQQKEFEREVARENLQNVEEEEREALQGLRQAEERIVELREQLEEHERRRQHKRDNHNIIVQEFTHDLTNENIQITHQCLGRGGWAQVNIAHLRVTAKEICLPCTANHLPIVQSELSVMCRVCHPNLQRFLGAVIRGDTVTVLNEYMPTSLKAELERQRLNQNCSLPEEHIIAIAFSIAHALNYLHHMTPDPTIHRQLSSANVLLQPTPDGGWLAKVSDYGTANFLNCLRSENPGSPVYTAPESRDPALQTPKMDIYSFGVLLVEMCVCELPERDHLHALIETIEQHNIMELAEQCVDHDMHKRPNAEQLILLIPFIHTCTRLI